MMRDNTKKRAGKPELQLDVRARYLTPLGRLCRLVSASTPRPGAQLEATFVYIDKAPGQAGWLKSDRFTLTKSVAQRTLTRVG